MKLQTWKFKRILYLLKIVAVPALLVAALGVLLDLKCDGYWALVGQVLICISVIAMAWLVVAIFDKVLRNKTAFTLLFLAVMAMGVCVYSGRIEEEKAYIEYDVKRHHEDTIPSECSSWTIVEPVARYFYAIDNTLSVFFPSRGDYYISATLNVWYYLYHFFAYFFAAWVLFSLFGKKMISMTLCWAIRSGRKSIFWGYSVSGKVLAKSMMEQKEFCQPVFVLPTNAEYDSNEDSLLFDELMDFGAIVVHADFDKPFRIKGKSHFFMLDRQDDNVSLALRMIDQLDAELDRLEDKTHLYVQTEIEGIDALFQAKYSDNKELKEKVAISIFNQCDLAARSFVTKYPLLNLVGREFKPADRRLVIHPETATVSGECHVLLLGLGWSGYELLRKIVCDSQFLGDDYHFSITVIDENFQKDNGRYMRVFEAARRIGIEINVNPAIFIDRGGAIVDENRRGMMCNAEKMGFEKRYVSSVNGCDFYHWLEFNGNILHFDRIIVSLGNDELNTNTAMQLHRFRLSHLSAYNASSEICMPEKIFAHVQDSHSYGFYGEKGSPVVPFGGVEEVSSVDTLIRETMDNVAKLVNFVYSSYQFPQLTAGQLSDSAAVDAEWNKNDTNLFNQNSSRSVALNIANVVRIGGGIAEFRERMQDPLFLEKYAEMEHKRWNAFHVTCGIDVWDRDKVSNKKGKLYFEGLLARHICIVDYEDLDEMSQTVRDLGNLGEDYKESDRRIVRHFPLFYDMINK